MHELTAQAIKNLLDTFPHIRGRIERIDIYDSDAKGLWFWKMNITVQESEVDLTYILKHIYFAAKSIGRLNGEGLDPEKINGRTLHLS